MRPLLTATFDLVIKAAPVLYNFVQDFGSPDIKVETLAVFVDPQIIWGIGRPSNQGLARDGFVNYIIRCHALPIVQAQ